jgi:hypothetical protein
MSNWMSGAQNPTTQIVANLEKPTCLVLRLKQKKPVRRRRWLFSWKGLEHFRTQVHNTAREVVAADLAVRERFHYALATSLICEAMRDITLAATPEVERAARAQMALFSLQAMLVHEKGLEFDFVRKEWATILDPSPEEQQLSNSLADIAKEKDVHSQEEDLML